jgi:hypothetical protein
VDTTDSLLLTASSGATEGGGVVALATSTTRSVIVSLGLFVSDLFDRMQHTAGVLLASVQTRQVKYDRQRSLEGLFLGGERLWVPWFETADEWGRLCTKRCPARDCDLNGLVTRTL